MFYVHDSAKSFIENEVTKGTHCYLAKTPLNRGSYIVKIRHNTDDLFTFGEVKEQNQIRNEIKHCNPSTTWELTYRFDLQTRQGEFEFLKSAVVSTKKLAAKLIDQERPISRGTITLQDFTYLLRKIENKELNLEYFLLLDELATGGKTKARIHDDHKYQQTSLF